MHEDLVKRLREYAKEHCPLDRGSGICGCIDAREAADAIEELGMKLHGDEAAIAGMKREIERMVVAGKPRWIPVTERLPEKREWVLVRSKFVKMKTDFISSDGSWYTTPGVTHWMPLPEPPKEEA